jgi:catechol 2,3-dioxygenase-like lactoylglutathione lyase family enzyme
MVSGCATPPPSVADQARARGPLIPGAHFHDVHMNVTDPAAAVAFYTSHFKAVPATFAGQPAVWVQRSWIVLNKVDAAPSLQEGTAINHFGWGSPNPPGEFERQKMLGSGFVTPLTDMSASVGLPSKSFYFMYVRGPNNSTIEINTSPTTNFGHIHLRSADPAFAAAWYRNMFGATLAPPVNPELSVQTLRGGFLYNLLFDNISMIFAKAPEGAPVRSTLGSVTDHIGVSVPNLDKALTTVRAHKVMVLQDAADGPCKPCRHAMIEGPDKIAIELIEDHAGHPPITN